MKIILLCNAIEAAQFRRNANLSPREAIQVTTPHVLEGVRFREDDLILEWPDWRDCTYGSQQIVDALKRAIARGDNAGPDWVSSKTLTAT